MNPKWELSLKWRRLGTISDVYASDSLYYRKGPLLYCASLIINKKFLEVLNSDRLKRSYKRFSEIVADNNLQKIENSKITIQNSELRGADRRFFHLMEKWKEIQDEKELSDEILLYIGKVDKSKKEQTLGVRLFESHDPAVSFPIFYLRMPLDSITIYTARVPKAWDLAWVERCEIFRHKPVLNLQFMTNNPIDKEDSAQIENKIESKILESNFTITHEDTFPF